MVAPAQGGVLDSHPVEILTHLLNTTSQGVHTDVGSPGKERLVEKRFVAFLGQDLLQPFTQSLRREFLGRAVLQLPESDVPLPIESPVVIWFLRSRIF